MQSWLFAYYTCSNFDILIAVALLDLKAPISLKPDWIQLCVTTVKWSITKYRGDRKLKRVQSLIHITSLPEKDGFSYQRVGGFI